MGNDQPISSTTSASVDPYMPAEAGAKASSPVSTASTPTDPSVPPSTFTNLAPHDPAPLAKNTRRMLTVTLIIVAVLLLLGAAAYATFARQTPEDKIKKAFANMAELDSFAMDGRLTSSGGFGGALSGQFDSNAEAFSLQLTADILFSTVKLDLLGINDILYVKTEGVVEFFAGFLGVSQKDIPKIKQLLESKYIRISPEDSPGQLLGQEPSTATPSTPQISEADQEKIAKLVEDTEFFKVSEKLGTKDIKGSSATGYKIVLQAEGIRELARGLRDVESLKPLFANQNQQEFEKGLAENSQENLDKVPFEVWLSQERVAQVALEMAGGQSKGRFELDFSRFGESFNIQAPADSRPFSEVLPGLQSAFSEFNSSPNLLTPSTPQ